MLAIKEGSRGGIVLAIMVRRQNTGVVGLLSMKLGKARGYCHWRGLERPATLRALCLPLLGLETTRSTTADQSRSAGRSPRKVFRLFRFFF